jgi:restriction system protein
MSSTTSGASTEAAYHWPADLLPLLGDTIPRLVRSKQDVLDFFRGCGVPASILGPVDARFRADPDGAKKYHIVRSVLVPLNDRGDATLAARREVVKRVVEFENFSTCWPNDALAAKGLVAEVRDIVNRKDSFTRMHDKAEAAVNERRAEAQAKLKEAQAKRAALASVKEELFALFSESDPWKRGKALEGVLNRLCEVSGILIEEAFTLRGEPGEGVVEQIDGVIRVDAPCLVEMKWLAGAVRTDESAQHLVRVYHRPEAVRGLLISANGFSDGVVGQHRDAIVKGRIVALCGLDEIVRLLDEEADLGVFLRTKMERAATHRDPYYRPLG